MNLCLNMIVRNEGARIERALKSVAPFIQSWVIIDTGSTDDTKQRIIDFFREWGIPGEIRDEPFVDFAQARNVALRWAATLSFAYQPTHLLLMDADMELFVGQKDKFLAVEGGISYEMYQKAGNITYTNTRILTAVGAGDAFKYAGVTHEYLDAQQSGVIPQEVAMFVDHADGTNRKEKYKRDIRLLKQGLKDEPDNARYFYYLAQSYRDAGKPAEAAKWFQRRVRAGGWDEEVWQAQVGYAHALKDLGDIDGFITNLLTAYHKRPQRAEAMYDLAKYFREHDNPEAGLACAEAVEHLSKPTDKLFVNDHVYEAGLKEEIAICAFYVPGKMEKGRRVNDELSLKISPHGRGTNEARNNQFYYVSKLKDVAPSFRSQSIQFDPPGGLVPMNPSVCSHHGGLYVNVRAVNYRIDADGRYIIKASDGTANAENPIDTRNFLLYLGREPFREPTWATECYRPGNMLNEFPLVTGFEDMRLFSDTVNLWTSSTVRQLAADGQCEQVLTRIDGGSEHVGYQQTEMKRMLRVPRETEKNWAPIECPSMVAHQKAMGGSKYWMWRPGIVINDEGRFIVENPAPCYIDNLCGSSQVIRSWEPWRWVAMVHTSAFLPGSHLRYYHHRLIEYGDNYQIRRMSLPFVFDDKQIEFCAGMTLHAPTNKLVISYGSRDCEARIATLEVVDAERLLAEGHSYGA